MAKTRIKTTPTRMQKDALMATTATAAAAATPCTPTCQIAAPLDDVKHIRYVGPFDYMDALTVKMETNLQQFAKNRLKQNNPEKRLRHPATLSKPMQSGSSSIIVTAPKRTNSISSVASSISQISDVHSDTESPPPQPVLTTTATKSNRSLLISHAASQAPRTLNSLLCKPTNPISALRNRKVFMITEKSDEAAGAETSTSTSAGAATAGQKRKMYLIMEENSCAEDGEVDADGIAANGGQKYLKRENGLIVGAGSSKKLTLFADKADSGALTEKFERILPEILNRIQAKDASVGTTLANVMPTSAMPAAKLLNGTANLNVVKSEPMQPQQNQQNPQQQQLQNEIYLKKTTEATNERLPITLPPKKNRTKIISTHFNHNNTSHNDNNLSDSFDSSTASIWGNNYDNNSSSNNINHKIGTQCQIKQISAATPVIVSAATVAARNNNHSSHSSNSSSSTSSASDIKRFASNNSNHTNIRYASNCNGQATTSMPQVELVPQKNINLSTDFHFLIKMLPKLESIPEPHKNNVKNCIERIITQNANIFAKQ